MCIRMFSKKPENDQSIKNNKPVLALAMEDEYIGEMLFTNII